ncbi:hypothetical protein GIB67_006714 [Kingdonia uniflora]|uniref:Kinesin motor domain-containing protein n=1 Tax=Kingdonia uniflora TaxID=39325 RepID=A0A7J7LYK8_9MAGN|nr:hypothetical protein GIB67_006714 [Kingdonia uniflora]
MQENYEHSFGLKSMESRKSVRKLSDTIRSLLGLKAHFTPTWADSVCKIVKELPYEEPYKNGSQVKCLSFETMGSSENIQDDIAALYDHLNRLNLQRRQALNDFLDLKGNIRVLCRIRPMAPREEIFLLQGSVVAGDSNNVFLKLGESKSKRYSFDTVFHPGSSQGYAKFVEKKENFHEIDFLARDEEVFSEVEPVIKSALDGYNACIFAYGQTGTGKTFTMEGKDNCPGVVPRAIEALFKQAEDSNHAFLFTFSMLEIYMGNLRDLLVPQMKKSMNPMPPCLTIKTDPKGGIEIENLIAIRVNDFNQAKRLYVLGNRLRSTASTNSNATSSRSHCLTRITMTFIHALERHRETNKIWMIDLGGSERVLKTKTRGKRFDEGKAINLSLSALGDVISALQRRRSHIPYRNSKLTQVLRDSLGEDSKTLMLVHVSPKEEDLCETVCSLGFATRVKSIHLGHLDSSEVQVKKEVAMAKFLQKVKQLEYEQENVRRDIKNLKADLEHRTMSEPSFDEHFQVQNISDASQDSQHCINSQLPRFMMPTICSRSKSGVNQPNRQISQKKDSLPTRRRKTSSIRAASVTFPITGISEYGSEFSVSRTASECDIKMVICPEEGNSESNFTFSKTHSNYKMVKNDPTTYTSPHGSKRVLVVPLLEKKNKIFEHDKAEKLDGLRMSGGNMTEPVNIEAHLFLNDSAVKDSEAPTPISPLEKCDVLELFILQEDGTEKNVTNLNEGLHGNVSKSEQELGSQNWPLTEAMICPIRTELIAQELPKETLVSDGEMILQESPHYLARPCLLEMRCRRDLSMDLRDAESEHHASMSYIEPQEENTKTGILDLLRWKVHMVYGGALLGLGVQNIGLDDEFFYGLML